MEKLHNKNTEFLDIIIEDVGYPTIDKVGKEANEAAWLIIQHAIGQPTCNLSHLRTGVKLKISI